MPKPVYNPFAAFLAILIFSIFVSSYAFANGAHEGVPAGMTEMAPAADDTHHIEVKPATLEGYRIPYMEIYMTIIDQETKETKTFELGPMFGGNFHYGANIALKPKLYLLRFHLDPPALMREGPRASQWAAPVEAEFLFDASVQFNDSIDIGVKETADMKIAFETEHAEEMFMPSDMMGDNMAASTGNASLQIAYAALLIVGVVIGFALSVAVTKKK